jgi:Fe-S cluster biogenesis protein NfuA
MKRGRARRVAAKAEAEAADIVAARAKEEAIVVVEEAEAADTAGAADTGTTDQPLLSRIEAVLEKDVRPGLREDGGDVVVVGLDKDNILQVRLTGACQGCSSSIMTLTMRVEATLKAQVPEIRFVEAVP